MGSGAKSTHKGMRKSRNNDKPFPSPDFGHVHGQVVRDGQSEARRPLDNKTQ